MNSNENPTLYRAERATSPFSIRSSSERRLARPVSGSVIARFSSSRVRSATSCSNRSFASVRTSCDVLISESVDSGGDQPDTRAAIHSGG